MTEKKTGGPAFGAHPESANWHPSWQGMTLRDYFAAKALLVVMPSVVDELQRRNHSSEKTAMLKKVAAEACYGMADAMLKARDGNS